jgi:hypothetical protein
MERWSTKDQKVSEQTVRGVTGVFNQSSSGSDLGQWPGWVPTPSSTWGVQP